MQGSSPTGRRSGRRGALILAVSHVLAAGLIVFAVTQFGATVHDLLAEPVRVGIVAIAAIVGIVFDTRALLRRSFTLGLARQTSKALLRAGHASWVPPLFWGLDTGLIWTTYRVSFCSWVLLVLAAVGIAPAWAGVVYGLAWALPLLAVMRFQSAADEPRVMSPRSAQAIGVGAMAVLAVIAIAAGMWPTANPPTAGHLSRAGSAQDLAGQRCDDSVVESNPGAAAPPLAGQRIGDISGIAFVGSTDTWFIGARGGRWAGTGGPPDFSDGAYLLKVGIYTLDSHPPAVTVRRTDGFATGRASFHPVSGGLPGPLPTLLRMPTAGCWDVTARGTTGSAHIQMWIDPKNVPAPS